jgi:DNA invertase Pin-like site-specific DNA recombinase
VVGGEWLCRIWPGLSTGSQDETSQVKVSSRSSRRSARRSRQSTFRLHGYSASHGTQEPALREAIADIARGDYSALVVTESSRLDRREDLDAQAGILLAIRSAGGDVISVAEPQFGKSDFAGRIVTLVAQHANAEKSKTVKDQTYRGVCMIRDNGAHHGSLPVFWETRGERWAKQAFCADPAVVADIYERVAGGESLRSIGRRHSNGGKTLYTNSITKLVRFAANHTGVIEERYTHSSARTRAAGPWPVRPTGLAGFSTVPSAGGSFTWRPVLRLLLTTVTASLVRSGRVRLSCVAAVPHGTGFPASGSGESAHSRLST